MQRTSDLDPLDDPMSWITATPAFTFDAVIPGLYQGDFPTGSVDWSRFDDVVSLTIEEVPDVPLQVGGLRMHVPIWDEEMVDPTGVRAAALTVAERVTAGKRVLVHCWAGLNRSGVVSARALMFMGMPVAEAIARVRSARGPYALSNRDFVAWLHEEAVAYGSGDAAKRPKRPRQLLGGA
jgi:Dual specificity phosphatase, catalytic domain